MPSRSTTPPATTTVTSARGAQGSCPIRRSTSSRSSPSPRVPGAPSGFVDAATARTKSEREMTPAMAPSSTTKTRFTRLRSSSSATCASSASGPTATTPRCMTSAAVRPWVRTNSSAPPCGSATKASHHERRFCVDSSGRRTKSASLTTPSGTPAGSTTGTALIACASSSRATASTVASGGTLRTPRVMISDAFIA